MVRVSYADVFGIEDYSPDESDIRPGDLVRTGPNLFPHFTVVAVDGDKVWLRNIQSGMDALAALGRCQKINGPLHP